MMSYERNKSWRERNSGKRHAWKLAYRRTTGSTGQVGGVGRAWTSDEDRRVLNHSIPDRDLAARIDRSVTAIQIRRSRLKSR